MLARCRRVAHICGANYFWDLVSNLEPQANKKFFDPTIFQKCWRGSGRVALIAARRQRNPCAMLLAHGAGGEKSESFSRRGEQDRPALWNRNGKQVSCNCSGGTVATKYYFTENPLLLGIPSESGSARLGHIPSLPWKSQLPLKPYLSLQPFIFKGNCDSFDSLLDFCLISLNSFYLLRKCGLLAHTSAAFLKNCCTEKLLFRLRLGYCSPFLFCFYVI